MMLKYHLKICDFLAQDIVTKKIVTKYMRYCDEKNCDKIYDVLFWSHDVKSITRFLTLQRDDDQQDIMRHSMLNP